MVEIEAEASLQKPLLSGDHSVAITVDSPVARWSQERKPPGLTVAGEDGPTNTPLVSPRSAARFQQGSWLLAAVAASLLYAAFMFAAILSSAYGRSGYVPWLFVGAATSAILSSGLVFSAALRLHRQRLEHHEANSHRYRRRKHSHRQPRDGTPVPPDWGQYSPAAITPTPNPGPVVFQPNLGPSNLNPGVGFGNPDLNPELIPTPNAGRSVLFKALPHLVEGMSGASTPRGAETPGKSTPSLHWNLAIGVDPKQEVPVSLALVGFAAASLAASALTTLSAFTLAEAPVGGAFTLPLYLGGAGLLLFAISLGCIAYAVIRRGGSPDGTYAALWLVVDAPPYPRQGTPSRLTPRTPRTPRVFTTDLETLTLRPPEKSATPLGGSSPGQVTMPQTPTPRAIERTVARILRGTVKTNIVVAMGGLYLNLPLAIIPIVASMFLVGPGRLVESDQRPLVYGVLFPLLFLVSALDFATFFFFVPRSISAIWLALKHPRIASSHVRSGRGAMVLSSVVLFAPFAEFYFCVACVTVYMSAEGGSVGFGDLPLTPWQCFGMFSAGVLVIVLTSLVCIVSLKVRLSQWMEPHKLSSRTTKGVVYATLLVIVVVGLVMSLFQSVFARSLCLVAFAAFVPILRSRRQAEGPPV